jgi:hypothetical protein
MDQTTRGFAKTRTPQHQLDRAARVTTHILELQNRCAGDELAGGFDSRPPPLGRHRLRVGASRELERHLALVGVGARETYLDPVAQ